MGGAIEKCVRIVFFVDKWVGFVLYICSYYLTSKIKFMSKNSLSKPVIATEEQYTAVQEELNQMAQKEFSRYKQDCRKRAIGLAHYRLSDLIKTEVFGKTDQENLLIAMADTYYNWLISIPNE